MKYKRIRLVNKELINFALSNEFDNVLQVQDCVEDSKTSKELVEKIKAIKNYEKSIIFERETNEYIRIKLIDVLGNIKYLIIEK